jgi:hypothetical protein
MRTTTRHDEATLRARLMNSSIGRGLLVREQDLQLVQAEEVLGGALVRLAAAALTSAQGSSDHSNPMRRLVAIQEAELELRRCRRQLAGIRSRREKLEGELRVELDTLVSMERGLARQ